MALTRLQQDANMLKRIDDFGEGLTPSEVSAVEAFTRWVEQGRELTEKQRAWAEDIDERRVK